MNRIRAAVLATVGACAVVGVSMVGAGTAMAAETTPTTVTAEVRGGSSAPADVLYFGEGYRLVKDLPVIPWRPVGDIWD